MLAIAVGGKATELETGLAAGDQIEHARSGNRAQHLGDNVADELVGRKLAGDHQPNRNGRIEVSAGDAADRIGHGEYGETKSKRNAEQADADLRKGSRQHRAAATAENEPECTQKFRRKPFEHAFAPEKRSRSLQVPRVCHNLIPVKMGCEAMSNARKR
ncbi:hypothetical protein D9M68_534750 [compost metagenome]